MKKILKLILFITILSVISYIGSNLMPIENIVKSKEIYKVVIDPGHGGKDPGATGTSGQYEKIFTLGLAKKIKGLLEEDSQIEVYMTREEDTFLSAKERFRPKFANELNADLYISIHGNTFDDPDVTGTQSFYYHGNSKALTKILHKKIVDASGFVDRGVKKEDYFVLKDTTMPAVLLEIGYLTNPEEEQKMLNEDFQKNMAMAIYDGIREYLKIE